MRLVSALLLLLPARSASAEQKHAELLSATDAAQLKAVFFSGDPWLVQCGTKADISAAIVDDGFGAHAVVEKAVSGLPKDVKVGLLDCHKKLPSGKTTVERFKLDSSVSPLLVLAANGKTVQITPSALTKHGLSSSLFPGARTQAAALVSYVKAKSEPKAYAATTSEQLSSLCLKRKHCVLLLLDKEPRGEAARTVHKLLHEFRTVSFVTINTARYELSLARLLPAPVAGVPQLVAIKTTASADGDKRKVAIGAKAHRGDFTAGALQEFVASHVANELQLAALKKVPTLRWRKQDKGSKAEKGGKGKADTEGGGKAEGEGKSEGESAAAFRRRKAAAAKGGKAAAGGRKGQRQKPLTAAQRRAAEAERRARESERREQMAAEEDEALRGMFADADEDDEDEGDDAPEAGGDEADEATEADEEVMDFDEAEVEDGGHDEL